MKSYTELSSLSKEERFKELLAFVTTQIKNKSSLEVVKDALNGHLTEDVMFISDFKTIAELISKGFVSDKQCDCLIELAKINN